MNGLCRIGINLVTIVREMTVRCLRGVSFQLAVGNGIASWKRTPLASRTMVTVVALAAGAVTAQGQEQELASAMSDVLLFDTGVALAGELPSAALAEKAGWVKVEEDAAPGQLKGDAVFLNGRIAVVLRKSAAGAEIYSHSAKGWQRRALLAPAKAEKAARLHAVKMLASDPDAASVEAVFEGQGGESLGLRYGLTREEHERTVRPDDQPLRRRPRGARHGDRRRRRCFSPASIDCDEGLVDHTERRY